MIVLSRFKTTIVERVQIVSDCRCFEEIGKNQQQKNDDDANLVVFTM